MEVPLNVTVPVPLFTTAPAPESVLDTVPPPTTLNTRLADAPTFTLPPPRAATDCASKLPPCTFVPPLKLLLPLNTTSPLLCFTSAPVPLTIPLKVNEPPPATDSPRLPVTNNPLPTVTELPPEVNSASVILRFARVPIVPASTMLPLPMVTSLRPFFQFTT